MMRLRKFVFVVVLALACALVSPVQGADSQPVLSIAKSTGFCVNGVWDGTQWPAGRHPDGLHIWGSFCGKGNDNVGHFESEDFLAPPTLNLYLAGYPGLPGRRLILKNIDSGEERELIPPSEPKEIWQYNTLPVPPEWVAKRVRFIAEDQATGLSGWLAFSLPILPAWTFSLPVIDISGPQAGFCPDGAYGGTKWPETGRPVGISTWGSYCKSGDADTGWAASAPVNADAEISIYVAGYPDTPGLALAVENMETGQQIPLHITPAPRESWQLHQFRLPAEWNGQLVRVIAQDHATGRSGWLAFSQPLATTLTDRASRISGRILLLTVLLILPPLAVGSYWKGRSSTKLVYVAVSTLLTIGCAFWIYFSGFRSPTNGIIMGGAGLLTICVVVAYGIASSKLQWLSNLMPSHMPEPSAKSTLFSQHPNRRWVVIFVVWGLSAIAVLPAIFHWTAPLPLIGTARDLLVGLGYVVAVSICYFIFRAELRRLSWSQAIFLVFLVFLLTCITNNVHSFNVDNAANLRPEYNRVWQNSMQEWVIQLGPWALPHSYRFLPNSIVRWMQLAHLDFYSARDLYRLIVGLLLFYSIYKYARLYCNYTGALIAMLLVAVIYPISFEYYAGQLTDPLSHLSFVLAFIFLETEEFMLLFTTLIIGSLAKESVLAIAGYYAVFCRQERHYPVKAGVLCLASVGVYFGVRLFVLHGAMHYQQVSGVTLENVWDNWQSPDWRSPFLLTACALLPFLALGWKEIPLVLKRQAGFLLPVLFISSLFFSGLREGRNYMPVVFVLAVVAGGYLTRHSLDPLKHQLVPQINAEGNMARSTDSTPAPAETVPSQ